MTDLLYSPGDNPGGLYSLRFVPVVGVSSLPLPAAGTVAAPPIFVFPYRWFQAYGSPWSAGLTEEQTEGDNGNLWSVSIELFLPGDSAERRAQLAQLSRHRFIVECTDYCGLLRRVGTRVESLQLKSKFTTGSQINDKRGYALTFSGTLTAPAPLVG